MESSRDKLSFDDCVLAYYAELMESKTVGQCITREELDLVSDNASRLYLPDQATAAEVDEQSKIYSHPFGRLCMSGLLDIDVYYEWAVARERPRAADQVKKLLASRRNAATIEAGGNTYESAGLGPIVVDAAFLRKK